MRAGKMTALSAAIGFVQTARLYKLVTSLNEEQIQFQTQLNKTASRGFQFEKCQ